MSTATEQQLDEQTKPVGKARKTKAPKRRRKRNVSALFPLIGALVGIALLLYPVFATRFNNVQQQKLANEYSVKIKDTSSDVLQKSLEKAERYNNDLASGLILDPFIDDVAPDSPDYREYLKELNTEKVMGQVRVPSAQINLPIYHGTEPHTLEMGVGHLYGSSLPIGGKNTHAVLTGHTGLPNATLFDNLTKVKEGDAIYMNVSGRDMKYVVNNIRVVLPTQTKSLKPVDGKDLLTLITCTPYGVNSHRLLVTGERAPLDPVEAQSVEKQAEIVAPWDWWMIVLLVGAVVAGLIIFGLLIRLFFLNRRRRKEEEAEKAALAANPALALAAVPSENENDSAQQPSATTSAGVTGLGQETQAPQVPSRTSIFAPVHPSSVTPEGLAQAAQSPGLGTSTAATETIALDKLAEGKANAQNAAAAETDLAAFATDAAAEQAQPAAPSPEAGQPAGKQDTAIEASAPNMDANTTEASTTAAAEAAVATEPSTETSAAGIALGSQLAATETTGSIRRTRLHETTDPTITGNIRRQPLGTTVPAATTAASLAESKTSEAAAGLAGAAGLGYTTDLLAQREENEPKRYNANPYEDDTIVRSETAQADSLSKDEATSDQAENLDNANVADSQTAETQAGQTTASDSESQQEYSYETQATVSQEGQTAYDQAAYDQAGYQQGEYSEADYAAAGYDQYAYAEGDYQQGEYAVEGYDQAGYDQAAYDQAGYQQGEYSEADYAAAGYDQYAYAEGDYQQGEYAVEGYDQAGYDQAAYDQAGYQQGEYTAAEYAAAGYDQNTYVEGDYQQGEYAVEGYDQTAYDQAAYDQTGYDQAAYDQAGYQQGEYTAAEYAAAGYDQNTYAEGDYQQGEYAVEGYDQAAYDQAGYDQAQYQSAEATTETATDASQYQTAEVGNDTATGTETANQTESAEEYDRSSFFGSSYTSQTTGAESTEANVPTGTAPITSTEEGTAAAVAASGLGVASAAKRTDDPAPIPTSKPTEDTAYSRFVAATQAISRYHSAMQESALDEAEAQYLEAEGTRTDSIEKVNTSTHMVDLLGESENQSAKPREADTRETGANATHGRQSATPTAAPQATPAATTPAAPAATSYSGYSSDIPAESPLGSWRQRHPIAQSMTPAQPEPKPEPKPANPFADTELPEYTYVPWHVRQAQKAAAEAEAAVQAQAEAAATTESAPATPSVASSQPAAETPATPTPTTGQGRAETTASSPTAPRSYNRYGSVGTFSSRYGSGPSPFAAAASYEPTTGAELAQPRTSSASSDSQAPAATSAMPAQSEAPAAPTAPEPTPAAPAPEAASRVRTAWPTGLSMPSASTTAQTTGETTSASESAPSAANAYGINRNPEQSADSQPVEETESTQPSSNTPPPYVRTFSVPAPPKRPGIPDDLGANQ
ncbi:hypothetical protein BK816_08870 [Boudabousia tangfeifanii]|uniref:Class C sortase n=1 Tax=Boudabousia tangfeifanii TaxID=1912795 RepID=A0A1D9MMF1_9ACTO|nr:class C sortase [Boudabousia tangfeifanii]AOZ73369.1 hypothetical protein BK816_08870 [Boudabousia tangfeifanii]